MGSTTGVIEPDPGTDALATEIVDLTEVLRRVVARRVPNRDVVDEIVQETAARVLAARDRLDGRAVGPYAIVTARNLVASRWKRADVEQRHEHRLVEPDGAPDPDGALLEREEADAVRMALERLAPQDRDLLLAHVVDGRDLADLAEDRTASRGAVAAQLNRSRAKLRVEYLLELEGTPPSRDCRPVLFALSAGDRRRQAEVDAGHHLLACDFCADLSAPLLDRQAKAPEDAVRVGVRTDQDIVTARQRGREMAVEAGFADGEATLVATAISEIARNIVRFAHRGEVALSIIRRDDATGVAVVARDAGPGIADIDLALTDGYTTYGGLGLGLPGCRRLMDEFDISSEVGRGTTVTMTRWRRT